MSRKRTGLRWKFDNGFYFAHAREGMWSIEQKRGRFLVELRLADAHPTGADQDMGSYKTLKMAQSVANGAHRAFGKLDAEP